MAVRSPRSYVANALGLLKTDAVLDFQALPSKARRPSVSRSTFEIPCDSSGAPSSIRSLDEPVQAAIVTHSNPAMPSLVVI